MARAFRSLLAALAASALTAGVATAELSGYVEFSAGDFETSREDAAGQLTETESETFRQRYNIDFNRLLYPNLTLRLGGFFEQVDGTFLTGGQETETTTSKLRPFFRATLRQPIHTVELSYDRSEERRDPEGLPATTDVRETYAASLSLFPADLPQVRLDYFHVKSFDEARLTRDVSQDRLQMTSSYRPVKKLQLLYVGTRNETSDRLNDSEVDIWSHAARVTYGDSYWKNRVRLNLNYNVTYDSIETTVSGEGEVRFPISRLGGLSSIDDTPEEDELDSNPLLVDGNLTASAGVNLLIPEVGGDDRPRNIGLQFAGASEVNALLVRVDQELSQVADRYSWDVYISDDNEEWEDWVRHDDPDPDRRPAVVFDPFLNLFEIEFPDVTTNFAKLVVSPLRPSDLLPADFPQIVVTELQAELRRSAADVGRKRTTNSHISNIDVRTKILDTPAVHHELTYLLTKRDPNPTAYRLSNGLSLTHRFNPVYALSARVARDSDRLSTADRDSLSFSASLVARAIETLEHRLVVSTRNRDDGEDSRDSESVFLFTTARLFRGGDLNLGLGRTGTTSSSGRTTLGHEVNASATLVPHRTMTVNLAYRDVTDETSGGDEPQKRKQFLRTHEIRVAYNPLASLYLFGSYRVVGQTDQDDRRFGNYTFNWSPFRDGTLKVGFTFDERQRSEDDAEERIVSPRLRWNFRRGSFFDVAYQKLTTRAISQRVDDEIVSANLNFAF